MNNVEIRNVYPIKDRKNKISLHVYIPHMDLHIRNVIVTRTNDTNLFVCLPMAAGVDKKTGKRLMFPLVDFGNKEYKKNIINEIKQQLLKEFKK